METSKQVGQKLGVLNREIIEVVGAEEVLSSTEKEVYVKMEKEILQVIHMCTIRNKNRWQINQRFFYLL